MIGANKSMRKYKNKKMGIYLLVIVLLFLTSCTQFTGLRTPLYDGEQIKPNEKAIEAYHLANEVIGLEKEFYIRDSFSEDILKTSLDYLNEEPFLLRNGSYIIGEDLPAGRVTLLGNESVFSPENYDVHVGNLIIYDEDGKTYFENLFHSEYGQLTAQLDLIEGHEIKIIGKNSEITVFYSDSLPKEPYVLMELPAVIKNLDQIDVEQPIDVLEDGRILNLTAGIYEVGLHLEAGKYTLSGLEAPHNTEMYLFREGTSPRVIELLIDDEKDIEETKASKEASKVEGVKIELLDGDKIYLNLVKKLELIHLSDN